MAVFDPWPGHCPNQHVTPEQHSLICRLGLLTLTNIECKYSEQKHEWRSIYGQLDLHHSSSYMCTSINCVITMYSN